MPALTPSFLFDLESEMDRVTEVEFNRMIASDNLWWRDITKVRTTGKKREILAWLLSTAQIYQQGGSGNAAGINGAKDVAAIRFDDMAATYQEYDVQLANAGLKLSRNQIEDNDGNGFDFASEWSAQMGAYMAYWPQKLIAQTILTATSAPSSVKAYDGVNFFAGIGTPHPVNQFRSGAGSFANLFTGAQSGTYPGALPIDETNCPSVDTALLNLQKAIAYIASIKMPNGKDPRFLKPRRLLVPPRLVARAQQLTNARYIAQAAPGGGGGSGDVQAIINNWGFLQPLEVQEFGGVSATQDLTWYLVCEQATSTQLGAMVYVDREPFTITYYTGSGGGTGVDAVLDRARELEWHVQGRNVAGTGHPYAIYCFLPT